MTNLKEVNFGINQYCGPAVLSILTGESTDRCAAVISAVSGKKEIKAVERAHIKEALKRLRCNVEETNYASRSLYSTLFNMHSHDGTYLVFVPHHVIAVEIVNNEAYICDNHTKSPINIQQSARLSQKCEGVWRVTVKDPPRFIGSSIKLTKDSPGTNFHMSIVSVNRYENPEDDNQYTLGYFKYKDNLELKWIVEALQKELD